ncbi:MAG: peptide deformylase [Proteobacteria bacterium]|nr:peptide deformylase [Pseudomonadota bacterium]MDE3208065.1 peptide deformylase [Pseudomonadota bacterium]
MALLTILRYPDPRLHTEAVPVERFDNQLHQLLDDMSETMYANIGVGLAATQVDVHVQAIVIDLSEKQNQKLEIINPQIVNSSGDIIFEEGCLSLPGIYERVKRAETIELQFQNRNGNNMLLKAEGLLAVCIQHEMDHLKGHVFIEYLSRLKQDRITRKLEKSLKRLA